MSFRSVALSGSAVEVHEALTLAGQLFSIPESRYAAEVRGGQQFLHWDTPLEVAVSTRDLLLQLIAALGGSSITEADLWPRPEKDEEQEVGTIADFNVGNFMRELAS